MANITAQKIVLASRPKGKVVISDFRLEPAKVPEIKDGDVLLQTKYLSIDPYMRGRMDDTKSYASPLAIGDVMIGESIAEVVISKNPNFVVGDIVAAPTGWQTHFVSRGTALRKIDSNLGPITTALGILGMPGFTAYVGMRMIGQPKPGETVIVAAASGPVGSLVGQLARKAGLRVVGIAGGSEKCRFVHEQLGFDVAIDHKAANFKELLADSCPKGIDIYFENVGGAIWQAVLPLLNKFARVPVCGLIAQYNGAPSDSSLAPASVTLRDILTKSLTVRGFINHDFKELYPDFLKEVSTEVKAGRFHYKEHVVDGLENAPQALLNMLDGRNFGKLLVRVS